MRFEIERAKTLAKVEEMKINYCCSIFGINRIDVVRWGIDDLFLAATELEGSYPELIQNKVE